MFQSNFTKTIVYNLRKAREHSPNACETLEELKKLLQLGKTSIRAFNFSFVRFHLRNFHLSFTLVTKTALFYKKLVSRFETRSSAAYPPLAGGALPSPRGFANYRPLRPIIRPTSLPAQLRAPLGGRASLRAFDPSKRRGRPGRVRGWSRIFNRRRSEGSAAV